jgi:hypothetical protein
MSERNLSADESYPIIGRCRFCRMALQESDNYVSVDVVAGPFTCAECVERLQAKSTHTPGPWEVEATDTPGESVYVVVPALGQDGGSTYAVARVDEVANARVIAAVPDLIAAMAEALEEYDAIERELDDTRPPDGDDYNRLSVHVRDFRAALVKAKGEA